MKRPQVLRLSRFLAGTVLVLTSCTASAVPLPAATDSATLPTATASPSSPVTAAATAVAPTGTPSAAIASPSATPASPSAAATPAPTASAEPITAAATPTTAAAAPTATPTVAPTAAPVVTTAPPASSAPIATAAPTPTPAPPAQATASTVFVTLVDVGVKLDRTSAPGGTVTFTIKNSGSTIHELIVLKTDVPQDQIPVDPSKPAAVTEPGFLGQTGNLAPGASTSLTLTLGAGKYVLMCNQPAHYLIGMHAAFTAS